LTLNPNSQQPFDPLLAKFVNSGKNLKAVEILSIAVSLYTSTHIPPMYLITSLSISQKVTAFTQDAINLSTGEELKSVVHLNVFSTQNRVWEMEVTPGSHWRKPFSCTHRKQWLIWAR
jgi:hypothetical protein